MSAHVRLPAVHLRRVALVLGAAIGLACRDDVAGPGAARRSARHAAVAIACTANRATSTVRCGAPSVASGGTAAGAAREARVRLEERSRRSGDPRTRNSVILGGQGDQIDLRVEDVRVGESGDTMAVTMRLQNLLPVALGSSDGETPSANLAAWVYDGPVVTAGAGVVSAVSADSATDPVGSSRIPFFYFAPRPLPSYALSLPTLWRFVVPPTATEFVFRVLLLTELEDETVGTIPGEHTVSHIAAGATSACFIRADQRKTYCWGEGEAMGFARPAGSHLPTEVRGYQFTSIAAAGSSRCGITPGGRAYCWGDDAAIFGGLIAALPTPVFPGLTVKSIALSGDRVCAIAADSTAWCQGHGLTGELGAGGVLVAPTPVEVGGHIKWRQLSNGQTHVCGLSRDSTAYCWGDNSYGQLGNGSRTDAFVPTRVSAPFKWRSVSAGAQHSCAIAASGAAYCWGRGDGGRLGNNIWYLDQELPDSVWAAGNWGELAAGSEHSCGSLDGVAYCWGNNSNGQLGDGSSLARYVPTAVSGTTSDPLEHFRLSQAAPHFTCTTVRGASPPKPACWGANGFGQLGENTGGEDALSPRYPEILAEDIAVGDGATCGLQNRVMSCWGYGFGALLATGDDGRAVLSARAVLIGTSSNQVQAGLGSACALLASQMRCWGSNQYGQLANTDSVNGSALPVPGAAGFNFDAISMTYGHGCGKPAGLVTLFCWGRNDEGQLGAPSPFYTAIPIAVPLPVDVAQIATGIRNTCILDPGGAAYCWGANQWGQIPGAAIGPPVYTPTLMGGGMRFHRIAVGALTICGIERLTRRLYCWGSNTTGLLGIGFADGVPHGITAVASLLRFEHLAMGYEHTCATTAAGAAYCWGLNLNGEIGQLVSLGPFWYSPTRVPGDTPFANVVAGNGFTCAISLGGEPWCWGMSTRTGHGFRYPEGELHKVAMPSPLRRDPPEI